MESGDEAEYRRHVRRCGGRSDRCGGQGHALDPRRARFPGQEHLSARKPPFGRFMRRVQGYAAHGGRSRGLRLLAGPDRVVLRRRVGVGPSRPAGRGSRLCRHRQQLAVPLRQRRSARRSRGQSARHRDLYQPQHHREPELLHHSDGRRPATPPRGGRYRAHQRSNLSVGLGDREGGDRRARGPDHGPAQRQAGRGHGLSQADRVSMRCPTSTSSWTTAIRRKR